MFVTSFALPGQLRFGLRHLFFFVLMYRMTFVLQVGGACYVFIYHMSIGNHVRTVVICDSLLRQCLASTSVACTFLFLQSYRTLAEWEFGWGGTSVIMQHRCPKGSSVRTETSLRV